MHTNIDENSSNTTTATHHFPWLLLQMLQRADPPPSSPRAAQVPPDRIVMSDEVKALASEFEVTVFFKQRQGALRPLALVKGTRRRSRVVERAAERLRAMLTGETSPVPFEHYTLQVDMPTSLHSAVIGKGGSRIKRVMDITGTSIRFPEASQGSAVFISGSTNQVKIAHAFLHGLQAVQLSFDLTADQQVNLLCPTAVG